MKYLFTLIFVLFSTMSFSAGLSEAPAQISAQISADLLASYLKNLNQFSADISETLLTDSGQKINNTGHVWIERPNKFRYEITTPEAQIFISDGKNLYDYEPDLMQVVVRPLDQSISQTPLLLLSSGAEDLQKKFKVSLASPANDHKFVLIPLAQDGLISEVVLNFDLKTNDPESMQISNSFGQITALTFSNVIENQVIPENQFIFTVPKGVDVLGG